MSVKTELPRVRLAQDANAGLREKILSMISDPQSDVVAFPAPRRQKLRHIPVTPDEVDLVPSPHDATRRNGVRLILDQKRAARSSLVMSLGGTVLGALAIGAMIGGILAYGKVSALGSLLIADTIPVAEAIIEPEDITAMVMPALATVIQ